jgi:predicted RNase H-like HicB family nuclease
MEYVIIFEGDENGYSAYVPELPVCIAAGDTIEEVRALISEAIAFHIEGLQEDGDVVPAPSPELTVQIDPGMLVELGSPTSEIE